jgi:DNA-binding NtrC family response regulator
MTVRVLVVDDDDSLRRALPRILVGFDVVVVATAPEALRALADRGPIDALLTDYGISPTDGLRLLREVATSYPGVRRYLMSGFDPARFDEHVASGLVLQMFPKPVDIPALKAALRGAA